MRSKLSPISEMSELETEILYVFEAHYYVTPQCSLPLLASSVQLQEEVNSQSIEVLSNYVEEFQKCMHTGGMCTVNMLSSQNSMLYWEPYASVNMRDGDKG